MGIASLYKETAISTQNKGKLIVMLYEGAVKFLKLANKAIDEKDYEAKNNYINRAMDIIKELNIVLDMEAGGEVSQNLRKLYNFMLDHLFQANIKLDKQKINEVIEMLDTLNQGWKEIV